VINAQNGEPNIGLVLTILTRLVTERDQTFLPHLPRQFQKSHFIHVSYASVKQLHTARFVKARIWRRVSAPAVESATNSAV
jgi:hypothetical protein